MVLSTTLGLAAAAIVLNLWLSIRIGQLRTHGKILYGDGGDEMLLRRMRAHANFAENTPLVLILIGVIELTGKGGQWLAIVGAVFMLSRISHALGMDGRIPLRIAGSATTQLIQVGLVVVAVLILLGRF